MKKVMILMNVLMGFFMSLALSLVGSLFGMRGNFNIPSWLISFGVSFIISLIIGFAVPIKKLGDNVCDKLNVPAQSFKGTLVSAAISDIIYTPVITIIMVTLMMSIAAKHAPAGSLPPLPVAIISSLILCLIVGYIVIVIIQPILIKALTKNMPKGPVGEGAPNNEQEQ